MALEKRLAKIPVKATKSKYRTGEYHYKKSFSAKKIHPPSRQPWYRPPLGPVSDHTQQVLEHHLQLWRRRGAGWGVDWLTMGMERRNQREPVSGGGYTGGAGTGGGNITDNTSKIQFSSVGTSLFDVFPLNLCSIALHCSYSYTYTSGSTDIFDRPSIPSNFNISSFSNRKSALGRQWVQCILRF